MYFWFLCTEICLLTGKYENVCQLTVAMNLTCIEPDFAIISIGKKDKFLFGSLASGFFCNLAVMLSLLILLFGLIIFIL